METKKTNRYIHGLNGLRTLAVLGVIFYHLTPEKLKGGYLGVPVFFAISGYLITDHLLKEWQSKGKIDLKSFFTRRLSRLYPTLLTVMIVSTAYITLFQRNLLNNLKGTFLSVVLYFNNWYQINNGASYFDRFNNESPFTHMWYLSVEFQNYLIWPIVFVLLMKFVKKRSYILYTVLGVSLASAIAMAVMFTPGSDPTRVYYGTDTRLFSIWMGAALAFVWPSGKLKPVIPVQAKRLLNGVGVASLLLLVLSFFFLDANLTFIYYGGMFLVSLLSVILVATIVHPGASMDKWLSNPLFDYIGSRSYGIYLWQFPVMIFYESKIKNLADNVLMHTVIELVIILLLSELSYQLVEKRIKKIHFRNLKDDILDWWDLPWGSVKKIGGLMTLAVIATAIVGLAIAPTNQVDANQQAMKEAILANRKIAEESKKKAQQQATADTESKTEESTTATTTSSTTAEAQGSELAQKYGVTDKQLAEAGKAKFTFFGDSVMLGALADLNEVFTSSVVDAEISRQLVNSVSLLNDLKSKKLLNDTVVIGLGTNGAFTDQQFDEIMKIMGTKRKVYWLNMRAPSERTQGSTNEQLNALAKKYKNLKIIDWYSYSIQHNEWFWDDQIHLRPEGSAAYTKMIVDTFFKAE